MKLIETYRCSFGKFPADKYTHTIHYAAEKPAVAAFGGSLELADGFEVQVSPQKKEALMGRLL